MDEKELSKVLAARRILESVVATVIGGIIVWVTTTAMSTTNPPSNGADSVPKMTAAETPNKPPATSSPATETTPAIVVSATPETIVAPTPAPPQTPAVVQTPTAAATNNNLPASVVTTTDTAPQTAATAPNTPVVTTRTDAPAATATSQAAPATTQDASAAKKPATSAATAIKTSVASVLNAPSIVRAFVPPPATKTATPPPPAANPAPTAAAVTPVSPAPTPVVSPMPTAAFRPAVPTPVVPNQNMPKSLLAPNSPGQIFFYENFSLYADGSPSGWGSTTFIKRGLDHRNWLVSSVEGIHPVSRRVSLPNTFYFECRYTANLSEVTRGLLGWWKDPVASRIVFIDEFGAKRTIEWVNKCGNDPMHLNPLGSSSLYAKKCYASFKLPDGTSNEIAVTQSTGLLRIERNNTRLTVFIDGQQVVSGSMKPLGPIVGFEIDVVKAKNGELFFTDFKIAR